MKRLGLLVSLVLLSVVGTTTTTQAYYLDTPHNESNGIYCYTCHYQLTKSLNYTGDGGDPDYTFRNAICLMCHAAGSTHPNKGPAKKAHSSATTGSVRLPWTTECTQCHDVHSQGQLDYAGIDNNNDNLFLATGSFDNPAVVDPKQLKFWPADAAGGDCKNVMNPTKIPVPLCGTTTVGISNITAIADPNVNWADTSKWGNKGGQGSPGRGLVLVPNKLTPSQTFEIISVSGNILKVKGDMTKTANTAPNGQLFGVIYGQSIKSFIMPNGGTTVDEMRDVKFFRPALIPGEAGGYVDMSGSPEPQGLCQACHTNTVNWTTDGANNDHNTNPATPCNSCHIVSNGGGVEVFKDHTTYIAPTCLPCHALVNNTPDKHGGGCSTCHVMGSPTLALNTINNNQIANENLGVKVLDSLLLANYTYNIFAPYTVPRLQDIDGTDIQPTAHGGDADFEKITCGVCHPSKPAMVLSGDHGGHLDTDFGWDPVCRDCHDPGASLDGYKDIHGNGSVATCSLCHAQSGIDDGTYAPRRAGTDGTAEGMFPATSTCIDCHSVSSSGAITSGQIHHVSPSGWAAAGTCNNASCHGVVGHKGDHSPGVDTDAKCNSCHAANAATGQDGTPVDPDNAKVHDNCIVCHKTDGAVRTQGEVVNPRGILVAMPALGGTCLSCHGDYFNSHTIDHATFVQNTTNCIDCHLGTEGDINNIPTGTGPKVHTNCASCHLTATTGLLKPAGGVAQAMQGVSATCVDCHTLGFNGFHQTVDHTNMVQNVTGACVNCHTQAGAALNSNDGTRAGRLVHDTCATCHQNNGRLVAVPGPNGWVWAMPTNATFGGNDGGGTCTACHGPFESHITVSHVDFVATSTSCNTTGCHPATAGDATGVPRNTATPDRLHDTCFDCHNANGTYPAVYDARVSAMPAGNNSCTTCHGTFTLASHTSHNHKVSYNATNDKTTASGVATSCAICHNDAGTSLATWAAIYQEHLSNCDTCHSYTVGTSPPSATNLNLIQTEATCTCVTCHTEKATGQPDHSLHPTDFGKTDSCTTSCHTGASVLVDIHGNGTASTCTMCHSVIPATRFNEKIGHSDFGIDGDCTPANGTAALASWGTKDCLTCHSPGGNNPFSSTGGMHHVNKGGITNCADAGCHSSGKLLHTSSVDTVADCNTCHDSIAGGSYARLAANKPYTAPGQVHDALACLACHALGASPGLGGILKTGTTATLNNNGTQAWDNGTDGGGTCTTCHGAYFDLHTNVDHTSWVGVTSACTTCHTGAMGDNSVNGPWISLSDNKKHDSCATCHQANGVLRVAPIGTTVDAMPTLTAATNDGGGVCIACHRATIFTFDSHIHHTSYNETVYSSTIDRSQQSDTPENACAVCHKDKTGTLASLDTFDGIRWEHDIWDGTKDATGGCTTCHDYKNPNVELTGAIDTPVLSDVTTAISTPGTKYCITCHVKKDHTNPLSTHGGHSEPEARIAKHTNCTTNCHTQTLVVGGIHPLCGNCHAAPAGGGPLKGAWLGKSGSCLDCHTTPMGPDYANDFTAHVSDDHVRGGATAALGTTANCSTSCHKAASANEIASLTSVHLDCFACHTNTTTNGTLRDGANGKATKHQSLPVATSTCATCHGANAALTYDSDFVGAHVNVAGRHSALAISANCSSANTCHVATTYAETAALHTDCASCHVNTSTDGTLNSGPGGATYGTATLHNLGSNSTCASCHASYNTNFSNHAQLSLHSGLAISDNCSTTCHVVASGNPVASTTVHTACASCHTNTVANGMLWGGPSAPSYGTAAAHTVGATSTCATCHAAYNTNFDTAHVTGTRHSGMTPNVGTTRTDKCVDCHVAANGAAIATMHTACTSCHINPTLNGTLNSGPGAPTYGTAANHTWGSSSNCDSCHTSYGYFGDATPTGHVHDHSTSVRMLGTDLANGSACTLCHTSAGTWAGIVTIHSTVLTVPKNPCKTCHDATRDINKTTPSGTLIYQVVSGVLNPVGCLNCHAEKNVTHIPDHSVNYVRTTATCVTGACHAGDVVTAVHTNDCLNCHVAPPGNLTLRGVAIGHRVPEDVAFSTCETCHGSVKLTIHHGGLATAAGNCHVCHPDPRPAASNIAYKKLACEKCHVKTLGSGIEIVDNILKGGLITGATGSRTGNVQVTIATKPHQFPNTTAISNYGACFSCHGKNGLLASRATKTVKPMHALPTPTIARASLGTENVLDVNQMGGGGYLVNNTISPNIFPAGEFKGGRPTGFATTIWSSSYFPQGKEMLNLGWTLHSQSKKAANIGTTKENNAGIITNAIFNIPAGLNYGTVTLPHDSNIRHFFPHFDATPGTLGVDTLTAVSQPTTTWSLAAAGTGPIAAARTITVNVTSSNSTATLSVFYGGKNVWTGTANGAANTTINIGTLAASLVSAGHQHVYASAGTGVVIVASDKGGSIKLRTTTNPGQGVN